MKFFKTITFLAAVSYACIGLADNAKVNAESTKAPQGGTFYYSLNSEPERLHPINSSGLYARYVQAYTIEGLTRTNPETYEEEPALAERWVEAKDGKSITFYLRKGVKFHNGEELTAELVKWNYDARMDDRYKAFNIRPYIENFGSPEVIDKHTIKFPINKVYFGNLPAIGSYSIMGIVPKSVYGDPNNKRANKELVGTGPYMLDEYKKGRHIILKRNPNWWGRTAKNKIYDDLYNYNKVFMRIVKEDNNRIEMLKKGKLDYASLTSEQFVQKAVGKPWGTKVLKKAVQNKDTKSYGFVGWNFKNPLFQDKKVRRALAHLMNRDLMNEKFRFNRSLLATGPWYLQSPYADKSVKPIEFSPTKAAKLLAAAGWKDTNKDGLLDKDGKPFKFSLMFANRDSEKYFTMYKEDLRKAGIQADLKVVEWNSFVKALDEQKFEAVALGWGGGSVHNNPKQIWHSESAKNGGSNFISYSNKEVDKLIDEGLKILDNDKRAVLWKQIYKKIADDAPYAFMFVDKYAQYAVNSRIGMKKDTLTYDIGSDYWWIQK